MPRVPELSTRSRFPAWTGAMPAAVARVGEEATSQLAELARETLAAQREANFIKLSGEMTGAIADLQVEIERDPEANTVEAAQARFASGLEGIRSGILSQARDEEVEKALQERLIELDLRGRLAVGRSAFVRETDAARADAFAALDQHKRSYALADTPEERALAAKDAMVTIDLPRYFTEQEREQLHQKWMAAAEIDRVTRLIDLGRYAEAQTLLDDREELRGIDEKQRFALERTLGIERERSVQNSKELRKEARRERANTIVQRILGEGPPITGTEILQDDLLDPGEREHYFALWEARAISPEKNRTDPNRYREVINGIRDGTIKEEQEIDTYLFNGLSDEDHRIMVAILRDAQKPEQEYIEALSRNFFKQAERQIFGTEVAPKAFGAERYNRFFVDKMEELRVARERGAAPAEIRAMFDEKSNTYLGRDIHLYKPTFEESIEATLEEIGITRKEVDELGKVMRVPAGSPPPPPKEHPGAVFVGYKKDGTPVYQLPNGDKVIFPGLSAPRAEE